MPSASGKKWKPAPAPDGIKIECSDATFQRLKNAAYANRCTIGQFVEGVLRNYLSIGFVAPIPSDLPPIHADDKKRHFQLSDGLFAHLERIAGTEAKAKRLIAGNILYALRREETRQLASIREPDRRWA